MFHKLFKSAMASLVFALAFFAQATASQAANPVVTLETSMGIIKIELYPEKSPVTVKNFIDYVEAKHYDGLIFHRVIPNFMIQGGGFEPGMKERKTKAPIVNESKNGLENKRGTLAMARTSEPDSASSQFFINVVDNGFLDRAKSRDGVGYCVFGKVIEGMEVVDKMKTVKTGRSGPHGDVPEDDIIIKSAKVAK